MKNSLIANVNTLLKRILCKIGILLKFRVITKSDNSKNGLKPFMLEFFIRECAGILHIGGHLGQEAVYYSTLKKPVIWIEGNPLIFKDLENHVAKFNQVAIQALISDEVHAEIDFYLTSNNSESASIFPLSENNSWDDLTNVGVIRLPSRRLEDVLDDLKSFDCEFWVIDVQGGELQVIRSAGTYLTGCCKYVLIEISTSEYYKGGSTWIDVRDEMRMLGFVNLWIPSSSHEEVLFINSKLC